MPNISDYRGCSTAERYQISIPVRLSTKNVKTKARSYDSGNTILAKYVPGMSQLRNAAQYQSLYIRLSTKSIDEKHASTMERQNVSATYIFDNRGSPTGLPNGAPQLGNATQCQSLYMRLSTKKYITKHASTIGGAFFWPNISDCRGLLNRLALPNFNRCTNVD